MDALAAIGTAPAVGPARAVLRGIERTFDRCFDQDDNPWHQLGALAWYAFWIVTVSGVYLYALFDTSVHGSWSSVNGLRAGHWGLGGLMRGLHRYASDAFAVFMVAHLAKEITAGRFRGFRWFSWTTGVPLLWLGYASAIGGFWLVWDDLAQFSVIATVEWLDALPFFGDPLARNFLVPASVDDRFFSLLMFLHIGIPLLLLAAMWLHLQRVPHARTLPGRRLALGTLGTLIVLAVVLPVRIGPAADLAVVPGALPLDWMLLWPHALHYATTAEWLWTLAGGGTLLLLLLPVLARTPPVAAAVVSPADCNGCGRCIADCPYAAVVLSPRSDGRAGPGVAAVLPDLCAACGICAGACPSSTPFRSTATLVSGIDVPGYRVDQLRAALDAALEGFAGQGGIVAFSCSHAGAGGGVRADRTAVLPLLCAGMLPPSFVEYALRHGASGVLLNACRDGECDFRLGTAWLDARLDGRREPHLRSSVDRDRLRVVRGADSTVFDQTLATFARDLAVSGGRARSSRG